MRPSCALNVNAPTILIIGYPDLADPSSSAADPIGGMLRKPFAIRDMQVLLIHLRGLPQQSSNVVRQQAPKRG